MITIEKLGNKVRQTGHVNHQIHQTLVLRHLQYTIVCVFCLVTKETQWADPRIAYQLQQQSDKALPVSSIIS